MCCERIGERGTVLNEDYASQKDEDRVAVFDLRVLVVIFMVDTCSTAFLLNSQRRNAMVHYHPRLLSMQSQD